MRLFAGIQGRDVAVVSIQRQGGRIKNISNRSDIGGSFLHLAPLKNARMHQRPGWGDGLIRRQRSAGGARSVRTAAHAKKSHQQDTVARINHSILHEFKMRQEVLADTAHMEYRQFWRLQSGGQVDNLRCVSKRSGRTIRALPEDETEVIISNHYVA